MRGSRNFHERGSNENGNFWSQTRGGGAGSNLPNLPKLPFLCKIFKFQGGGSGSLVPPPLDPRMVYLARFESPAKRPTLRDQRLNIGT